MLRFEDLPKVNSKRWLSLKDLPGEIWKDVSGCIETTMVSNYSRVKRVFKKCGNKIKITRHSLTEDGYYVTSIKWNGGTKNIYVHRLVAMAFLPNPENKPCVYHINTNRMDNIVTNLKWVTHKENVNNAITRQRMIKANSKKVFKKNNMLRDIRVAKLDRNGKLICVYNSIKEASIDNNLASCSISNAIYGRMMPNKSGKYYRCDTAGGYRWKYLVT